MDRISKLTTAFAMLLFLAVAVTTAISQEKPRVDEPRQRTDGNRRNKPTSGGPAKIDPNSPATRVGENSAGAAAVILATRPPSNEIRCRGGLQRLGFFTENAKRDAYGESIIIMLLEFDPGLYAAGPRGEGLLPGQCSWADRPIAGRFLIRFETSANAQLKQKLHGSPVDSSPTAAQDYPDARTIPVYMKDETHYWSFFGPNPVNNFFTATGNGYFRQPPVAANPVDSRVKDRDRVLIPTKPE